MRIRNFILAAPVVAAASMTSLAAENSPRGDQEPGTIGLSYSIAFWNIPFGQTSYRGKFSGRAYAASSHFETSGIVSLFWQATIDATASGRLDGNALSPGRYDSLYRRGSAKSERVTVTFAPTGVTTYADPPYDSSKYPVDASLKREALDPMGAITLVLAGLKADATNPCGTTAPVFDGRRRYTIEFTYLHDEPTKIGGLFDGTAHLCRLHYRQIAGFKPKILKEGAAFPPIYGEFADVAAAGAPEGHYVVPLKLWARLSWGTVSAQITGMNLAANPDTPK